VIDPAGTVTSGDPGLSGAARPGAHGMTPATESTRAIVVRFARALLIVIAFWWLATGLIVAQQRDGVTRALAALASVVLAVVGIRLASRARGDETAGGATRSFLGGALLWAWAQVAFYGGWMVGPATVMPAGRAPTWALALAAVQSTAYAEIAAAAALVAAILATRVDGAAEATNRTAVWTVVAFWVTHETAKLNVFLGVANPGSRFLPGRLAFLRGFFGPPTNSPLLVLTVVALAWATGWLCVRAWRATRPFEAQRAALLATLVGLATLEHALLALPADVPLWDVFLRARGY
jgi:putative photosynthetic complex assembly protein 2